MSSLDAFIGYSAMFSASKARLLAKCNKIIRDKLKISYIESDFDRYCHLYMLSVETGMVPDFEAFENNIQFIIADRYDIKEHEFDDLNELLCRIDAWRTCD